MNSNKQERHKNNLDIKKERIKITTQKIIQNNNLIKRILAYSAKKIKEKPPPPPPPPYSTLKPETSSDSPSAKSKGV
jgi:hypothetical protein